MTYLFLLSEWQRPVENACVDLKFLNTRILPQLCEYHIWLYISAQSVWQGNASSCVRIIWGQTYFGYMYLPQIKTAMLHFNYFKISNVYQKIMHRSVFCCSNVCLNWTFLGSHVIVRSAWHMTQLQLLHLHPAQQFCWAWYGVIQCQDNKWVHHTIFCFLEIFTKFYGMYMMVKPRTSSVLVRYFRCYVSFFLK